MSKADRTFARMCEDILMNGTSTQGEEVRPHWPDGTPAYTVKQFGVVNRYDLREEFPAITFRRTAIKSAMDEILWIWQKKSNNIHDLGSHIWDEWADKNGSIGKAYGYQQSKFHKYPDVTEAGLIKAFPGLKKGIVFRGFNPAGETAYGYMPDRNWKNPESDFINRPVAFRFAGAWHMTQLDKAIYDLMNTPYSRRIIIDMWNPEDQHAMNLTPCAYSLTLNVTKEEGKDELVLNGILNQRSQDVLAAGNWNPVQYSLLLMMLAQHCHMTPGVLLHVIADCHIYDRHIPLVRELISRKEYPAPKVWLNPRIKNFYDFTTYDLNVEGYETGPQIKDIPIAI